MLNPDDIASARTVDILAVAAHSGAQLRKTGGGEFAGPCPVCGGRDRFAVNVRKSIWNCRGCIKGGDVIDLVCHLGGLNFVEAVAHLIGETWPTPQIADAPSGRIHKLTSHHREFAVRIWRAAKPIFGTPAAAYLTNPRGRGGRNIDLTQIPDIDEVLRYHTACPFGTAQRSLALIALIRDVHTDAPIGIMRTPLSAAGCKAPIRNESGEPVDRWALGDKAGGAIKLWPRAAISKSLVVGEGLETVAAAATRIVHRGTLLQPAWALIDAGNVKYFPVLPEIERLTILVDNDANQVGQHAANTCTRRWLDGGRSIEQLIPDQIDSDFADIVAERQYG